LGVKCHFFLDRDAPFGQNRRLCRAFAGGSNPRPPRKPFFYAELYFVVKEQARSGGERMRGLARDGERRRDRARGRDDDGAPGQAGLDDLKTYRFALALVAQQCFGGGRGRGWDAIRSHASPVARRAPSPAPSLMLSQSARGPPARGPEGDDPSGGDRERRGRAADGADEPAPRRRERPEGEGPSAREQRREGGPGPEAASAPRGACGGAPLVVGIR